MIRLRFVACVALLVCVATVASAQDAPEILDASGVRGGLVVHLGCNDGKLTAALRKNDRFLVHGLDFNPENVANARRFVHEQNLYGDVSIMHWADRALPYAENMVNLLIVEQTPAPIKDELMRVLDTEYRYPGYHVGLVQNSRSGLVGRWIDTDGKVRGTPPEEYR